MKRITSISIVNEPDSVTTPELLGTYSDTPADGAIDRKERGDMRRGQFRYFNPAFQGDAENDYQRCEAFNNSEWSYATVRAVAEIQTSADGKEWLINRVSSGGVCVETDANAEVLVADSQLDELSAVLLELGFQQTEIDAALPK